MSISCERCVLSSGGLCDGQIICPKESYRERKRVCVYVCVFFSVIRCNNNPIHRQWLGRRGQTKQEGKKMQCRIDRTSPC
jgi:hypothetical protein